MSGTLTSRKRSAIAAGLTKDSERDVIDCESYLAARVRMRDIRLQFQRSKLGDALRFASPSVGRIDIELDTVAIWIGQV